MEAVFNFQCPSEEDQEDLKDILEHFWKNSAENSLTQHLRRCKCSEERIGHLRWVWNISNGFSPVLANVCFFAGANQAQSPCIDAVGNAVVDQWPILADHSDLHGAWASEASAGESGGASLESDR